MIKAGAIPHVVHEPPAGIRLLPSAPVWEQHRVQMLQKEEQFRQMLQKEEQFKRQQQQLQWQQQQQRQQQQQQQQQQAAGSSSAASPALSAASSGFGDGGINHARHQHKQHQQQHQQHQQSFSLPSSLASPRAEYDQQNGRADSSSTGGIPSTSSDKISFRSASDELSPPLERHAGDGTPAPAAATAAADSQTDEEYYAAADAAGAATENGGRGEEHFQFGSFEGPSRAAAAAPSAEGNSGSGETPVAGSREAQRREVDWKELNRNLNLLLKEEGELNGRDLTHAFQQRFGKVIRIA